MIVTTTEEIKENTGINKNISFNTLRPHVKQVEETIIRQIVGDDLYVIIDTNSSLSTEQGKLREYLKVIISNFALYYGLAQSNVAFSELGLQENHSADGTSNAASMWRTNDFKQSVFRTADKYREMAYTYMQNNLSAFTEWESSTSYTTYNKYLIRNNQDLHEVIGKGENTGTYLTLRPYIDLAQAKYIKPILCDTFLQKIIDNTADDTSLSDYEKQVRTYAKQALAWFALYEALPSIRCIIIDNTLVTSLPAESSKVMAPLSDQEKTAIQQDAWTKGENYIGILKAYLLANATELPDFTSTTCYTSLLSSSNRGGLKTNTTTKSFRIST